MRRTDAGAEQDMRMCHDGLLKPGVQVDAARAEMTRKPFAGFGRPNEPRMHQLNPMERFSLLKIACAGDA
jgi:hypothetical protein